MTIWGKAALIGLALVVVAGWVTAVGNRITKFAQFSITVHPAEVLKPMGFMLTPESPEGVKSGGAPVGVETDFLGLPRDPEHPSMGAIQYHEPTPDYMALVEKILIERQPQLSTEERARLNKEIDALFLKVYGYSRGELKK